MFATSLPITPQPRKPLFALLLSFVLPGFGQLYNGQINKALWLFLIFTLITVPLLAVIALYVPSTLMLPTLILSLIAVLVTWIYSLYDAWSTAKQKPEYLLKPWQYKSTYLLIFIVCNLIILPTLINYVRAYKVESLYIPSTSMNPTLEQGDILFADKRYNCNGCKPVERGDVAIFNYPNDRTKYYIKRVIALPNDQVELKGQEIIINGKTLLQTTTPNQQNILATEKIENATWQVLWNNTEGFSPSTFTVPAGQVFVLGDNRNQSTDSRNFGMVPMPDIVGKAKQLWYAKDWSRLGQVIH
ncbi:MAG: signal peptidase I [Thiofilum sp.]|uniref:signal peptidase I n=1 Tax=Thiofilum sp. TaxID=2212733 RepID=UPI0025F401FC|nr:signal peptidase I [Thiofilum sp.]MBK8454879.1 signal peptidase I [Thiofilum sp.]